jgi:acyl carrier protein
MDRAAVKDRIKRAIAKSTNLKADQIGDDASFRQELMLDSLSLLEIGVDVDYEFRLGLPDERYHALDSVEQTVDLVVGELAARDAAQAPPGGPAAEVVAAAET